MTAILSPYEALCQDLRAVLAKFEIEPGTQTAKILERVYLIAVIDCGRRQDFDVPPLAVLRFATNRSILE